MGNETFDELSIRAKAGILRSLRNRCYEQLPDGGLLLPKEKVLMRGLFVHSLNGGEQAFDTNLVVAEGRNHILDVVLHNQPATAAWYIALFSGNVTPTDAMTAANFASTATEFTAYDEATRVAYDEAAAVAGATDNFASKATFTVNDYGTVYGGAILSASAKSATTGVLLAAARFANQRDVEPSDNLAVGYQISLTST